MLRLSTVPTFLSSRVKLRSVIDTTSNRVLPTRRITNYLKLNRPLAVLVMLAHRSVSHSDPNAT